MKSTRTHRPLLSPRLAAGLLLSACAGLAQAQSPADGQAAEAQQRRAAMAQARLQAQAQSQAHAEIAQAHATRGDTMAFASAELSRERLVKGAPYCADTVHETVQTLADGNRIVRKQIGAKLCRDGEGRTRQEFGRMVYLADPVTREFWLLDKDKKTVRKLGSHAGIGFNTETAEAARDSSAWREYAERMREWAQKVREQLRHNGEPDEAVPPVPPVPPVLPPVPPAPVVITKSDSRDGRDGQLHREVQVLRVDRASSATSAPELPLLPSMQAPPAVQLRAMHLAPRGPGAVTPLGSREIDGIKVNGERTSWTIAAGKVGNEKPIVITREVWSSPDLMVTLSTRDFDPRSGEVNYRLEGLRRGEPDAALMRVPADYAQVQPRAGRSSTADSKR